ncbi:adenylyltransferase/cytidyltransferase family protein [Candidatus Collierbacteria bacterium]|nr:adenylyltransferase/cytidyltransferase family protein [Candidatus Collierbacteria bacterium]
MTVFVTGIFDLLHIEHLNFLRAAKKLGGKLVVGIESDARTKQLKGSNRPIMNQAERKQMLEALDCVDEVIVLPDKFNSDQEYEKILLSVGADTYAVSENSPFMENKKRICQRAGVTIKVVNRYNPEYSTTKLIEKLSYC